MTPFFFRLKAPIKAVGGFGFFARYERLPVWLAWDAFGAGNGTDSLEGLTERLEYLRSRIRFDPPPGPDSIGCCILLEPVFFPEDLWVPEPDDWKPRTQGYRYYDLAAGPGRELWEQCRESARSLGERRFAEPSHGAERAARYGAPQIVLPRLGQGTFRVATLQAYERACAVTDEHSLPVLDAAHILPHHVGGTNEVSNGILMRADLHRLFDRGYLTVTPDLVLRISPRLREDYDNGRSYYPLDQCPVRAPVSPIDHPRLEHLEWHGDNVFLG